MTGPNRHRRLAQGGEPVDADFADGACAGSANRDLDDPVVASWWWVRRRKSGKRWLGAVTEVGSNYAIVRGLDEDGDRKSVRLHLDEFHDRCRAEPAAEVEIARRVRSHAGAVKLLMDEIRAVCRRLCIPVRQSIAASADIEPAALTLARGAVDARAYANSLVQARDEDLPALFKRVEAEHAKMAAWMRLELVPHEAELGELRSATDAISRRVETVELYAGLDESSVLVRDGQPAGMDDRVHVMQRMHFMDEECLARYEAGGMNFEDVGAFDAWLSRPENADRIFPHPRTVVAFRVRRERKRYDASLDPFVRMHFDDLDRQTTLYVRNGEQIWRVACAIAFDEQLFPRREDADLLGDDELWVEPQGASRFSMITGRQRAARIEKRRGERNFLARRLTAWRRAGKPDGHWSRGRFPDEEESFVSWSGLGPRVASDAEAAIGTVREHDRPHSFGIHGDDVSGYELLTPHHAYYDDARARVRESMDRHNRVVFVLQGVLDRSTCLHPHPPWQLWTAEGFAAGVEAVYDASLAVTPGDPPDFNAFCAELRRGLRAGCHAVGQRGEFEDQKRSVGKHERHRAASIWSTSGPGLVDRVDRVSRDRSKATFRWLRDRARPKWVDHPDKPGYLEATWPGIPVEWTCDARVLICVESYRPGDYRRFYDDPRTRADYLTWAPILLACEDWHAKKMGEWIAGEGEDEDDGENEV